MPLVPTNPQPEPPSLSWRRACAIIFLGGCLTLALAGCADGSAKDAARGQRRDAERTAVVSGMQATRSANVLGTPIVQGTRTGAVPPALEANSNSATSEPFATAPESSGDSPPIVPVDPSN